MSAGGSFSESLKTWSALPIRFSPSWPCHGWDLVCWLPARVHFLRVQITADDDRSLEIKRCLLFGGRIMTNVCSILKSRDINLLTLVHIVKAMVFPVAMYGCESWTRKKTERWRTDAFKLWWWRSLLRVPWTAERSNQSIPQETNLEYLWKDWC